MSFLNSQRIQTQAFDVAMTSQAVSPTSDYTSVKNTRKTMAYTQTNYMSQGVMSCKNTNDENRSVEIRHSSASEP